MSCPTAHKEEGTRRRKNHAAAAQDRPDCFTGRRGNTKLILLRYFKKKKYSGHIMLPLKKEQRALSSSLESHLNASATIMM